MLQFIREKLVKIGIIVTLIMFIGLIFFGWGMSAYQSKKVSTKVGSINDKEIKLNAFYTAYNNAINQAQKTDELSIIKKKSLQDQVWNQFIEETIINDFFKKNNITVSPNEMINFLKIRPPQEIVKNPNFQTNGIFDSTKYINNFLNNPKALRQNAQYVTYLEKTYKRYLLRLKLEQIVKNVPSMSKIDENGLISKKINKGKFEFIKTENISFNDVKVKDNEAKEYYQKNKENYKRNETANIAYSKILKTPSSYDTSLVLNDAKMILEKLKENEKFSDLAKDYSETKGVDSTGGDLGYVRTSFLPQKIKSAIDSLKVGDVTKPIIFAKGVYIYKITDLKTQKDKDSIPQTKIRLSEIFMGIKITTDTEDSIRTYLDSLKTNLDDNKKIAISSKFDTTGFFEISKFVPYEGYIENISKFAYKADINEISDVLENDKAFYLCKLLAKKDAGYIPFEDVKKSIEKKIMTRKSAKLACEYLEKAYKKAQNLKISMDSLAKTDKKISYYKTPKFVTAFDYITFAGYNNEFSSAAFLLKNNQTTKHAISANKSAFIIKRLGTKIDSLNTKTIKSEVKAYFEAQNKNYFENWFNNLKENAKIEDLRYQFF